MIKELKNQAYLKRFFGAFRKLLTLDQLKEKDEIVKAYF